MIAARCAGEPTFRAASWPGARPNIEGNRCALACCDAAAWGRADRVVGDRVVGDWVVGDWVVGDWACTGGAWYDPAARMASRSPVATRKDRLAHSAHKSSIVVLEITSTAPVLR